MPGLAFFYAGLLHKRSAVTMIMQNFASMGIITILVSPPLLVFPQYPSTAYLLTPLVLQWFLFVFSLCFGHSYYVVGSITTFGMFTNVNDKPLYNGVVGAGGFN